MTMEESITYAKKYLEDLLSFFGLNTEVSATREEDVIELTVGSTHLNGFLIGHRGDTLRAIQYLVASALRSQEMELTRVNVDIADYKRHHNDQLVEKATGWAKKARERGEDMILDPMNPADRRMVHKAVSELSGLETESKGEGRDRHVVIIVKDVAEEDEGADNEPEESAEVATNEPSKSDENTSDEEDTDSEEAPKDLATDFTKE